MFAAQPSHASHITAIPASDQFSIARLSRFPLALVVFSQSFKWCQQPFERFRPYLPKEAKASRLPELLPCQQSQKAGL